MQEIELSAGGQVVRQGHTSKGDQPKWQVGNLWYKADHMGYEALAEIIAAQMLARSNIRDFVDYTPVVIKMDGRSVPGCVSENFRAKSEILVPLERLHRTYEGRGLSQVIAPIEDAASRIKYTVDFVVRVTGLNDFGSYLSAMLSMDAFFLNEDRHTNNIAVIRDDMGGNFHLCPYYDNGLSFLSDLNDYPLDADIYTAIDRVKAKPFSEKFDEQIEAAEQLYGNNLKFEFNKNDVRNMLQGMTGLYPEIVSQRVERVIYEQMRKYSYLF